MLMPEYFDGKSDKMVALYQQLSEFILKEIARFLISAGKLTPTADRLLKRLRLMGETQAEIEKKLQALTKLSRKELRALLQDAVLTSWKADADSFRKVGVEVSDPLKNPTVTRIMDAQYKRSQGELENLTRTTMKQTNIDLINMLSEADMRVAAGVQSYSAAISDILDRYAHRGIYVDYPKTNTRRTLEAAVMCCVRTSMAQMAGQVTMEFVKEAGTNLIITSAHTGARFTDKDEPANHMSWQGRVFYITDADLAEFTEVRNKIESSGEKAGGSPNTGKYPDFRKTTGYGTGEGLDGYNCRHSFGPYDERIGNPWRDKDGNLIDGAGNRIDSEESKQKYRDSQRLRAIERGIRATKRQLVAKEELMKGASEEERKRLQPEYDKLAYDLAQQNKKYNDFAKEHNLTPQYGRNKLANFGREQEKSAKAGAKRYTNSHKEFQKDNKGANAGGIHSSKPVAQEGKSSYNSVRSREELQRTAEEIKSQIGNYAVNPSKWSGKIVVDNSLAKDNILGEKRWSCDIAVNATVDNGTIWHEMLHSCSASYYDKYIYDAHKPIEEASVEFLSRQICIERKIDSVAAYQDKVAVLQILNNKFKYGTDMEFAKELFNIPLPERYQWLEDKVDESLRRIGASFEDFNETMQFILELKGGKHGRD